MNEHVVSILEHLEYHQFTPNHELSTEEFVVLENPLTERRVSLSTNDFIARFTMLFTLDVNDSGLTADIANQLNNELVIGKAILQQDGEEQFAIMNALYLMPYSKESFNTFWALFDEDGDNFETVVAENLSE